MSTTRSKPARRRPVSRPTWDIKGSASIVFFYFGDSYLTTLAQETLNLSRAFDGYDRRILLRHDTKVGPFQVSAQAGNKADVLAKPTRADLFEQIRDTAEAGYMIDLWIFSHGHHGHFRCSTGVAGNHGRVTAEHIETELGEGKTGAVELPIRMVYQMNCYGSSLNSSWRAVGAKVACGSRFVNFYPNRYGRFVTHWRRGDVTVPEALKAADTAASRTMGHIYIATAHAPSTRQEWGGCPLGSNVLGSHACARTYFTTMWRIGEDEWRPSLSGKQNMNYSSRKMVRGNSKITKSSIPSWRKR